jgi:DNA-binding NtrC family response regulator
MAKKKTVVIIDDNRSMSGFIVNILKLKGYEAFAINTLEAVNNFLMSWKDTVYVFLLDYSFDTKCNSLSRNIKSRSPQSKIVMTSGLSSSKLGDVRFLLKEKVIDGFLEKPFGFSDLEKALL